jgi:L-fuconolactonase
LDEKRFLSVVFEAFGVDRLMFGSDWPVCLVAAEYEQVIDLIRDYMTKVGFSVTDQAKVLGGNATKFYRLDE